MSEIIQLNGRRVETERLELQHLKDGRRQIFCDFKVTSDTYHDISVLLYEMNFRVNLPANGQEFDAAISNYFTDTTNLYEGNKVADYHLELTEIASA